MGNPWSGAYVTSSGNLLADFHLNVTAEMQGRLQVARLFHMTVDRGVKDLIRFLVTRDHMHQMMWLRAIEDIQAEGLDGVPVPEAFDLQEDLDGFDRLFIHASDGAASAEGSWASGPAPDGRGKLFHRQAVRIRPAAGAASWRPPPVRHSVTADGQPGNGCEGQGRAHLSHAAGTPRA